MDVDACTSEEESAPPASPSEEEEEDEGPYAFKRKAGCIYQMVGFGNHRRWLLYLKVLLSETYFCFFLYYSPKKTLLGRNTAKMKAVSVTSEADTTPHRCVAKMATSLSVLRDDALEEVAGECKYFT